MSEIVQIVKLLGGNILFVISLLILSVLLKYFRGRTERQTRLNEHSIDSLISAWKLREDEMRNRSFMDELLIAQRMGHYTPHAIASLFLICPNPYFMFICYRSGRFALEENRLKIIDSYKKYMSPKAYKRGMARLYYESFVLASVFAFMGYQKFYFHNYSSLIIFGILCFVAVSCAFIFLWKADWYGDADKIVSTLDALSESDEEISKRFRALS